MNMLEEIKGNIIKGKQISRSEALMLCDIPLEELCNGAEEIRKHFMPNTFDLCSIVNGKCGRCSENCKFCAQSAISGFEINSYPLLDSDTIVDEAMKNYKLGVKRFSIVTSGRRVSISEVEQICHVVRRIIDEVGSSVCVSLGLLGEKEYAMLKEAGVTRIHNNLEASESFFPEVCTTHTTEDKINSIKAAQKVGLTVCSGGIMGIGESWEDRIDMAFTLRDLNIKSVPVNMLNPIPETPFGDRERLSDDEIRRVVAIYRFILPDAYIRLAGGRGLMPDKGKGCFKSGANAAISGDMLTTSGISAEQDFIMLDELGYTVD